MYALQQAWNSLISLQLSEISSTESFISHRSKEHVYVRKPFLCFQQQQKDQILNLCNGSNEEPLQSSTDVPSAVAGMEGYVCSQWVGDGTPVFQFRCTAQMVLSTAKGCKPEELTKEEKRPFPSLKQVVKLQPCCLPKVAWSIPDLLHTPVGTSVLSHSSIHSPFIPSTQKHFSSSLFCLSNLTKKQSSLRQWIWAGLSQGQGQTSSQQPRASLPVHKQWELSSRCCAMLELLSLKRMWYRLSYVSLYCFTLWRTQ